MQLTPLQASFRKGISLKDYMQQLVLTDETPPLTSRSASGGTITPVLTPRLSQEASFDRISEHNEDEEDDERKSSHSKRTRNSRRDKVPYSLKSHLTLESGMTQLALGQRKSSKQLIQQSVAQLKGKRIFDPLMTSYGTQKTSQQLIRSQLASTLSSNSWMPRKGKSQTRNTKEQHTRNQQNYEEVLRFQHSIRQKYDRQLELLSLKIEGSRDRFHEKMGQRLNKKTTRL